MLCFKRWQTFNLDNSPVCHPWTPLRFLWVAKIDEINNKETMCPPMAEISKNDQKYRFLWILCQTIQKRKLLRPHDPSRGFFNTQCISLATSGLWLPVAKLRAATLLFLLHKKLKLDEILKTLQGVKEDPLGTPKHQRTKYFTGRFLKFWPISIFPPGFEPGTSRTLSETSTPRPRRLEVRWQKNFLVHSSC